MEYLSRLQIARTNPAVALAGDNVFAFDLGGRGMLAFDADSADGGHEPYAAQPAFFSTRSRFWSAQAGSTAPVQDGLGHNVAGNAVSRAVATGSIAAGATRMGFNTNLAAGSTAGWRHGAGNFFRNPSAPASAGGFLMVARLSLPVVTSGMRLFVGLSATIGALGNANPSSFLNMMGFCADQADASLGFMCNGASGAAQETALASPIAKAQADVLWDFAVYCARNNPAIGFAYRTCPDGAWVSQKVLAPTSAPALGVMLSPQIWINTPTTIGSAIGIDLSHVYVETDY